MTIILQLVEGSSWGYYSPLNPEPYTRQDSFLVSIGVIKIILS